MNMTITKKDAKLLLVLLGIFILMICYFTVYSKYSTMTDDMNTEISKLKTTAAELQGYYDKLDTYYAGIDSADAVVSAELAKYPAAVRYEDQVVYAIDLQKKTGIDVTGIAFANPAQVASFSRPVKDGSAVTTVPVSAAQYPMTLTCKLTYAQLKDMIAYVNSTTLRTALENVSVTYDGETGNLTGSAVISQYSAASGSETAAQTAVPQVPLGVNNLFGSYEVKETAAQTAAAN